MNKKILSSVFLFTAAVVWGFAFAAQKLGADSVSAFYFNAIRFIIGAVSLIPVVLFFEREKKDTDKLKRTVRAAAICAAVLFVASALQQKGIDMTNAGKGAFITAFYSVLVPIICFILFRKKTSLNIWVGALLAVAGLFLICIKEDFSVGPGDLVLLAGSVFWALHIIAIDKLVRDVSPIKFAMLQAFFCGIYNLVIAIPAETVTLAGIADAAIPLLYCGICSTGIAYTCQILGQKDADPAVAPIILSTESLFGAIGGAIFNNEVMTAKGYFGCVLIFVGVVAAQLNFAKKKSE